MEEKVSKKHLIIRWTAVIIGLIIAGIMIMQLFKPKIDYEAMATDLTRYAYTFDNVSNIQASNNSSYTITVKSDSWYAASERDKMLFCKKMNEGITSICWKYKAIKDTQKAYIYYYDEDGINIAEPGKGFTLESIILH